MSDYKPIEKLDYTFYKWIHISKNLDDLCYVGSTANIVSRKAKHKSNCNNPNSKKHNYLLYKTIREYGGFNNFKMVILGTAEQITKREAQAIEEQYRVAEKATLNMNRCYTTDEQKIEQKKQYYEDNKQKSKQYYEDNKQKLIEKAKKYYQENKEQVKEKRNQYIQANKEQVKERRRKHYKTKKAIQTQAEETQAEETQAEETQAEETQAEETQAKETQAEETQAKETILTEETQYLKKVKKPAYKWIVKVI